MVYSIYVDEMALATKRQLKNPESSLYQDLSSSKHVVVEFLVNSNTMIDGWGADSKTGGVYGKLLKDIFQVEIPVSNFTVKKISDEPKVHSLSVELQYDTQTIMTYLNRLVTYGINPESITIYIGGKPIFYSSSLRKPGLLERLRKK